MSILAAERIKLLSTRSPWWCMVLTIATGVTLSVAYIVNNTTDAAPATVWQSQFGVGFALPVTMVMAALAATNDYRFGTIRTTFQAVPRRPHALLAKAALTALLAAPVGVATAFASWGATALIRPHDGLGLVTGQHWRNVAGTGLVFALAAVVAVAVALLVQQTAGAVAILVAYPLVGELIFSWVGGLDRWLPLNVAKRFLDAGVVEPAVDPGPGPASPSSATLPPGWALAYYTAFALVLLTIALIVANRRDT